MKTCIKDPWTRTMGRGGIECEMGGWEGRESNKGEMGTTVIEQKKNCLI